MTISIILLALSVIVANMVNAIQTNRITQLENKTSYLEYKIDHISKNK